MKSHKSIFILGLTVLLLASYQFISAQWQAPTGVAPANNTVGPLDTTVTYQPKIGELGAVRMRAGEYCDEAGLNCIDVPQDRISSTCPVDTAIRAINSDGSVVCQTIYAPPPPPPPTCTYQTVNVSGCNTPPACPAGYTPVGAPSRNPASCGVGNNPKDTYTQTCGRNVCS